MTPLRLRHPNGPFPPKPGWHFKDERTGMEFDGMGANPDAQATAIIKHRVANRRLYPEAQFFDRGSVKQEVYRQTYARNPELFVNDSPQPAPTASPVIHQSAPAPSVTTSKACPKCGSLEAVAIMCATCGSGSKVTGYKCSKCGSRRGK